jgi:predicted AAA+ superfamily ATPase
LNEVHRGIEDFGLNFALTGSSARKLKRAGVNLLGGRAHFRSMLSLLPRELGKDFDIDQVLRWGSLPLIWTSENRDETLKDYVHFYLKEEIQAEALVRNLAGFARSIPVAALYNGQVLNISSLARDAEVERKTAEGYIQILEDTLLVKKLYPYQAKVTVREKKKPKLYWVDSGLVRAAKGVCGAVVPEELGSLFESYIFQMIRHEIENNKKFENVFYWSPSEIKTEVDFLIQDEKGFIAVEVKASKKVKSDQLKGLRAIQSFKGLRQKILLYLGEIRERTEDGIDILSIKEFEKQIASY